MKHCATLGKLVVPPSSVLEGPLNSEIINRTRFFIAAPNTMMVTISGSSESKSHHEQVQCVLDASHLQSDENLNMTMITADGLGESDDQSDNENNAGISAFCCTALGQQVLIQHL